MSGDGNGGGHKADGHKSYSHKSDGHESGSHEQAGDVKTAQPFSEEPAEPYADMGGGSPNKPRPDKADDPAAQAEASKTTQRQE